MKSKKIVLVGILFILLATSLTSWAGELRPLNLFINQQMIDIDVPVVYENYMPYVPLRFICEALNISISYDPSVKAVFVDGKMLEQPYIYYGRDVYLSLERVEEVLGLSAGLDGEYEMIAIYSPNYEYVPPTPYWGQKAEGGGNQQQQDGGGQAPPPQGVPMQLPGGVPPVVPPPMFP